MKTRPLIVFFLLFASGAALAQATLATVEVRAKSGQSLTIACDNPSKPSLKDVERVLGISSQTANFRNKLMSAAAEACKAGSPRIQVMHDVDGKSLKWKALH